MCKIVYFAFLAFSFLQIYVFSLGKGSVI